LADLLKTSLGFRAALGYEYLNFSLALETGYSHITGTNPMVLESTFIPLALKAGYNYPLKYGLGVQGNLILGYIFSRTSRYATALDMALGNLQEDSERSFFTGLRVYGTWTLPYSFIPKNFLTAYAGGGIDIINEPDGPLPLPVIEIGIHIHPLTWIPRPKPQPVYEEPAPEPEPEIEIYEEAEPETELEPEPELPPEPVRLVWLALFPPNKTTLDAEGLTALEEAAAAIATADGEFTLVLKGYAAPFVSVSGQTEVSRRRVLFCKKYLMEKYGIPEERITIEWHGAKNIPENTGEDAYPQRRSVEIIFEGVLPQ
jgi:outer membrane protein OmpA-like peptidoglycan-associated protein